MSDSWIDKTANIANFLDFHTQNGEMIQRRNRNLFRVVDDEGLSVNRTAKFRVMLDHLASPLDEENYLDRFFGNKALSPVGSKTDHEKTNLEPKTPKQSPSFYGMMGEGGAEALAEKFNVNFYKEVFGLSQEDAIKVVNGSISALEVMQENGHIDGFEPTHLDFAELLGSVRDSAMAAERYSAIGHQLFNEVTLNGTDFGDPLDKGSGFYALLEEGRKLRKTMSEIQQNLSFRQTHLGIPAILDPQRWATFIYEQLGYMADAALNTQTVSIAATTAGVGAVAGAAAGGVGALPGAVTGLTFGLTGGMALKYGQMEFGTAYMDMMLEEKEFPVYKDGPFPEGWRPLPFSEWYSDELGEVVGKVVQRVDPFFAGLTATVSGVFSSVLNLNFLTKAFPVSQMASRVMRGVSADLAPGISSNLKKSIQKTIASDAWSSAVGRGFTRWARATGVGVVSEIAEELAIFFSKQTGKNMNNLVEGTSLETEWDRTGETILQAAASAVVVAGGLSAVGTAASRAIAARTVIPGGAPPRTEFTSRILGPSLTPQVEPETDVSPEPEVETEIEEGASQVSVGVLGSRDDFANKEIGDAEASVGQVAITPRVREAGIESKEDPHTGDFTFSRGEFGVKLEREEVLDLQRSPGSFVGRLEELIRERQEYILRMAQEKRIEKAVEEDPDADVSDRPDPTKMSQEELDSWRKDVSDQRRRFRRNRGVVYRFMEESPRGSVGIEFRSADARAAEMTAFAQTESNKRGWPVTIEGVGPDQSIKQSLTIFPEGLFTKGTSVTRAGRVRSPSETRKRDFQSSLLDAHRVLGEPFESARFKDKDSGEEIVVVPRTDQRGDHVAASRIDKDKNVISEARFNTAGEAAVSIAGGLTHSGIPIGGLSFKPGKVVRPKTKPSKDISKLDTSESLEETLARLTRVISEGRSTTVEIASGQRVVSEQAALAGSVKRQGETAKEATSSEKYQEDVRKRGADRYNKALGRARKAMSKVRKGLINPAQADQIKVWFSQLKNKSYRDTPNFSSLQDFLQSEDGKFSNISDDAVANLKKLEKIKIGRMTVEDMEFISDAIVDLVKVSERIRTIRIGNKSFSLEEAREKALAEFYSDKEVINTAFDSLRESGVSVAGAKRNIEEFVKLYLGLHAHPHVLVAAISGEGSTVYKTLIREIDEGRSEQLELQFKLTDVLNESIKAADIPRSINKKWSEWSSESISWRGGKFTRGERISLYLHSKNEYNRDAILSGGIKTKSGDNPAEIHKFKESDWVELLESLTDEEVAVGEAYSKVFKTAYPDLNRAYQSYTGLDLREGKDHYPLSRSPGIDPVESRSFLDLEHINRWGERVRPDASIVKDRHRNNQPVWLNDVSYDTHDYIAKSSNYVAFAERLDNALKLWNSIKDNVQTRFGRDFVNIINFQLSDVVGNHFQMDSMQKTLRELRKNITVFNLSNPFTWAKQVTSYAVALPYLSMNELMSSAIHTHSNWKATYEMLLARSSKLRARSDVGISRDMADLLHSRGTETRSIEGRSLKEQALRPISWVDKHTVVPIMNAAFNRVLGEIKNGEYSDSVKIGLDWVGLSDAEINARMGRLNVEQHQQVAIRYADFVIDRTQPMFTPEHRSHISRGRATTAKGSLPSEWTKLYTNFFSFLSQGQNSLRIVHNRARMARAGKLGKVSPSFGINQYAGGIVGLSLAMFGGQVIDALRDSILRPDMTEEEKKKRIFKRAIDTPFGFFVGLRDVVPLLTDTLIERRFRFFNTSVGVPVTDALLDALGATQNLLVALRAEGEKTRRDHFHKFLKNSFWAASELGGLPFGAAARQVFGRIELTKEFFGYGNK